MKESTAKLAYAGVLITCDSISETDNGRILVQIPKSDIQTATLKQGSGAENPKLQAGFGSLLAIGGAAGCVPLLSGNFLILRYELALLFFGAIGAWMIWEAIRVKTYLLITTKSDKRKIIFRGDVETANLTKFLDEAGARFGYSFDQHDEATTTKER